MSKDDFLKAIAGAQYILALPDNFDDEGSKSYLKQTLDRASDLVLFMCESAKSCHRVDIDAPQIFHGPEGSIDVFWDKGYYTVLVNIPEDESLPTSYYGANDHGDEIKGYIDHHTDASVFLQNIIGVMP